MSFDPARPRYTLPFGDRQVELVGTFELIECVEYAMQEGIIQVAMRVMEMGVADTAKLLSAMITASGEKLSAKEAGTAIFAMGVNSDDFIALKLHLNAFINIALSPPKDRQQKAAEAGEMLGKWEAARSASRGETTSASA